MTNSEVIERLKYAHFHFRNEINEVEIKSVCGTDELKEFDLAISALQENTKLKAEIEQLKSELEQSVRLPCKVGDVIYDNDFGSPTSSTIVGYSYGDIFQDDYEDLSDDEELYFYSRSNRFNIDMSFPASEIGKTIFLSREEAEQHLKGEAEE